MKISRKTILLICVLFYSNEIFTQGSVISNAIRSRYENFREHLDKVNDVTKVRTAEGHKLAVLDFIGLVQQHEGYEAEEYDVQTEDGYILKLHRISSSPCSSKTPDKSVVLLQHGFAASSDQFVNLGPKYCLGYLLADAGYDVWLGNVRGNSYSRRHVNYSASSFNYNFWKFSIDDLGAKDTPTFIDSVLEKTNKSKLIYVGYSMGTMMSYMLLSTKSEYNDKIDLSISLAPVAYFAEPFTLFFRLLTIIQPAVTSITDALRVYEFFPLSKMVVAFAKTVCTNFVGKYLCGLALSPVFSLKNMNFNNVSSVITSSFFNGASSNTATHFCQLAKSKKFRKFDFGPKFNQEKYNCSEPPEYDLSKITVPQALFYSVSDTFVHPKGVTKLKENLKNVVSFEKVPESYKHFDFVTSKTAKSDYYDKILKLIKQFSQQ